MMAVAAAECQCCGDRRGESWPICMACAVFWQRAGFECSDLEHIERGVSHPPVRKAFPEGLMEWRRWRYP